MAPTPLSRRRPVSAGGHRSAGRLCLPVVRSVRLRGLQVMKRTIFKLLAAGSFTLFAALASLWVRSYWRADTVQHEARWRDGTHSFYRRLYVTSSGGGIAAGRTSRAVHDALFVTLTLKGVGDIRTSPTRPPRDWSITSHRNPAYPLTPGAPAPPAYRLGFQFYRAGPSGRRDHIISGHWRFVMPHWVPALAAAVLPAAWVWTTRRTRRRLTLAAASRCTHCGYDLRASPGRCPECGLDERGTPSIPQQEPMPTPTPTTTPAGST